jgi:glycosyltransferase involved in cell wall biosynthesis
VLTSVGGLEPEYDVPLQIDALRHVRERHPDAGLVVIGGGRLEADLRRRVEALPYRRDVLLCGDVPHAATLRVIERSDVLLRTTLYDGDSIAV